MYSFFKLLINVEQTKNGETSQSREVQIEINSKNTLCKNRCPECSEKFKNVEDLQKHIENHHPTVERKWICHCGQAFKRKDHCIRHLDGHMEKRPHVCHVCLKGK